MRGAAARSAFHQVRPQPRAAARLKRASALPQRVPGALLPGGGVGVRAVGRPQVGTAVALWDAPGADGAPVGQVPGHRRRGRCRVRVRRGVDRRVRGRVDRRGCGVRARLRSRLRLRRRVATIAGLGAGQPHHRGVVDEDEAVALEVAHDQARAQRGAGPAFNNGAPAESSLDVVRSLATCDVPHEPNDVRRLEVPHRSIAQQRQDMSLDPPAINIQGR